MNDELTAKQKIFVKAYTDDPKRNQTAAAIKAGYSEKTATSAASRLMKDENIRLAIEEIEEERHRENTAQENEIIEFLTSVMRGKEVDNIPLLAGNGFQEMNITAPSARDRMKAAELLGKYFAIFTEKGGSGDEGGVIILPEITEDS